MPTRRVSPQEAHVLVRDEGYVYVDVRSSGEYEQGHPQGSYNVPLAQPGPAGMAPIISPYGRSRGAWRLRGR